MCTYTFTLLATASPYWDLNPQPESIQGTFVLELLEVLVSEIACVNHKDFNSSIVGGEKQQLRVTILLHADQITGSHGRWGHSS